MEIWEKLIKVLFKILFPQAYLKREKEIQLIKDYPCPSCRPYYQVFFHDIKDNCSECGREYWI